MKIPIAKYFAHAARIAVAAGVMLLVGSVAGFVVGRLISMVGIRSVMAIFIGFALIAIIGISGGAYISVRYITPNSVLHPVAAATVLGVFPVGITLSGDVGKVRTMIVVGAVAVAVIAAFASRSRMAPPNKSLEGTHEG